MIHVRTGLASSERTQEAVDRAREALATIRLEVAARAVTASWNDAAEIAETARRLEAVVAFLDASRRT